MVVKVNGEPCPTHWTGRYLALGPVTAGQVVRVEFHISERTAQAVMGTKPYGLDIRGDTVVHINPPGKTGALYQRAHYRQNEPHWRNVTRFITEDIVDY
jgi:hypothetical protein